MTTVDESKTIATLASVKDYVFVRRVSWGTYQALLDVWGPRAPRHTYDRGSLEIMAKSSIHEILKSVIGFLLAALCEEIDRDFVAGGETTLAKEDVDRGIEPDQCFWIGSAEKVIGKVDIDFEVDPPPDLFIEIEISHTVLDRLSVLAALGVPEVWRFDGSNLLAGDLQPTGEYQWGARSIAFPELPLSELVRFVELTRSASHRKIIKAFRAWIQQNLKQS
jgi:Uma2 family endonuclease